MDIRKKESALDGPEIELAMKIYEQNKSGFDKLAQEESAQRKRANSLKKGVAKVKRWIEDLTSESDDIAYITL